MGQEDEDLAGLALEEAGSPDGEFAGLPVHLVPQEIRNAFVRKVFSIVGLQLLLTVAIAAPLVTRGGESATLDGQRGRPWRLRLAVE